MSDGMLNKLLIVSHMSVFMDIVLEEKCFLEPPFNMKYCTIDKSFSSPCKCPLNHKQRYVLFTTELH